MRALGVGLWLAAGALAAAGPAWGAETLRPPVTGSHAVLECGDCHTTDGLQDCTACHEAASNIHPVGVVSSSPIPAEFALAPGGELLCRSCHRLHGGNRESHYLNDAGLDDPADRAAFCARCHGAQLARTNPHQARQGATRCTFCHASIPGGTAGGVTVRLDIVRLCDFCHGAVAKDHPRNIDPVLSLPKGLPLQADGSWTCVTCHNPHGTTGTTHYVRAEFARHFERGLEANPHRNEYSACKGCHTSSVAKDIKAPDYRLRYKGDINVLCVSCHVTDRAHHPTGLPPPPFMLDDIRASPLKVPLDRENRITCYTCHTNRCETGVQRMEQRHYDRVTLKNDLCWVCHRRAEFSSINPHVDDNKMCVRCHESPPMPGTNTGLLTIPKMVCLQCHEVKPHPANADHLKAPTAKIKPDGTLPLGPGDEVTCVTCHDPHAQPAPTATRLRAPAGAICGRCHWR